jgi:pilus assembly protein Flp/PilA
MGSCDRFGSLGSGAQARRARGDPMNRVQNFLSDESGVTAIEYALIASLIAVFIVGALQVVGTKLSTVFTEVGGTLK